MKSMTKEDIDKVYTEWRHVQAVNRKALRHPGQESNLASLGQESNLASLGQDPQAVSQCVNDYSKSTSSQPSQSGQNDRESFDALVTAACGAAVDMNVMEEFDVSSPGRFIHTSEPAQDWQSPSAPYVRGSEYKGESVKMYSNPMALFPGFASSSSAHMDAMDSMKSEDDLLGFESLDDDDLQEYGNLKKDGKEGGRRRNLASRGRRRNLASRGRRQKQ